MRTHTRMHARTHARTADTATTSNDGSKSKAWNVRDASADTMAKLDTSRVLRRCGLLPAGASTPMPLPLLPKTRAPAFPSEE